MDRDGLIYMLNDEQREMLLDHDGEAATDFEREREKVAALREDMARLDGYLRGRAEADAPKRGKGANKDMAG